MAQRHNGLLIVLVILVITLVGCVWSPANDNDAELGTTVANDADGSQVSEGTSSGAMLLADYDATVYTDLGEPVRLSALAQGRPLVINFWATWCGYCVDEMPDFLSIYEDYQDRVSFAFVDATDGEMERAEDAMAWLAEYGFSSLPDYYDRDLEAVSSFGIYAYPTTVVVSADGEIMTVSPGRIDAALLRGALNTMV